MTDNILIVDDNVLARQMLVQQLDTLGFANVTKAANGKEALAHMLGAYEKGAPFHMVILDWMMPAMNGYDFLTTCRSDPRFAKTAIIMVSAEREDNNIIKALQAGATGYLTKPYTIQLLEEKIKQAADWLGSLEGGTEVEVNAP